MIDDVSYLEGLIKRRLPTVTVFQNTTDESAVEIDVQNVPDRPLGLIRILLTRDNVRAIRSDDALADRVIATLEQALEGPSDEHEALLDLREAL